MQEHDVQIRAVAELEAAELAVGRDGEGSRLACVALAHAGLAVAGRHVAPGQRDHLPQRDLGDGGQVIAHDHERHDPGHVRRRHVQHVGVLELTQDLHLLLEILIPDHGEPLLHVRLQRREIEWRVERAGIEQLVQQHRVTGELPGDPGARGAQAHQLGERQRPLGEQREVGAAPGHGLHDSEDPLQGRHGVGRGRDGPQQIGDEPGETGPRARVHHLDGVGIAHPLQVPPGLVRGDVSLRREDGRRRRLVEVAGPE